MPATVGRIMNICLGMTATGGSKFFRGRAGLLVAGAARLVQVCFTAGAGMRIRRLVFS